MVNNNGIDWVSVLKAYESSGMSVIKFYREKFSEFCPENIPSAKTLYKELSKTKAFQSQETNTVTVVELPRTSCFTKVKKEEKSRQVKITFQDGSSLEFFCANPEKFALQCLASRKIK